MYTIIFDLSLKCVYNIYVIISVWIKNQRCETTHIQI